LQSLEEWTKKFPNKTAEQVWKSAKDVRSLLANERIIQQRTKTRLNLQINDLTRRLNAEREIYSKNTNDYNNKIQKLERENTVQKDSFARLETNYANLQQDLKTWVDAFNNQTPQ
jgi:hypothetical protein